MTVPMSWEVHRLVMTILWCRAEHLPSLASMKAPASRKAGLDGPLDLRHVWVCLHPCSGCYPVLDPCAGSCCATPSLTPLFGMLLRMLFDPCAGSFCATLDPCAGSFCKRSLTPLFGMLRDPCAGSIEPCHPCAGCVA